MTNSWKRQATNIPIMIASQSALLRGQRRHDHARLQSRKMGNPRRFLAHLITPLPSPLISIQVDRGSALRDEYEQIGQALVEIPVFVLPPKNLNITAA